MSHRAPYHNSSPSLSASNGFPLKDPETPTKSTQPRRPIIGRQSSTFEDLYLDAPNQPSEARKRRSLDKRVWGLLPRRRRALRVGAILLLAIGIYLYLRPSSRSSSPKTTTKSSEPSGQIRKRTKPLHIRTNEPSRASLPASVVLQSRSGHVVKNGLLQVNMSSKVHPLYQLIRDAREAWDEKVAGQSKTLKQAVQEYQRRNRGRRPPKGFDKWWEYVVDNNVPLPDEYDQISSDLLPFRALPPAELLKRIQLASGKRDTYTIRVNSGSISTSVTFSDADSDSGEGVIEGARMRVDGQVELIKSVVKDIPDLVAVYTVHDAAEGTISWNHRTELIDLVEDGEYLPDDDELDLSLRGWSTACSASSPAQALPPGMSDERHAESRTFVSSHRATMDICKHPSLVPIHGLLSVRSPHHGPLLPLFCLSKTSLHADILGVPTEQYSDHVPHIPWEQKVEDKLLWRGSNTGIHFSQETPWRESHRIRMINIANKEKGGKRLLPLPKLADGRVSAQPLTEGMWGADKEVMNRHYLDLQFTDGPIQCSEDDGTCEELENEFEFVERMTHDDALHYKYVVDVDGNAWSARFQRLLASGSLIFKTTITPEWWTDRIQPWVHYIPIKLDYTDLHDTLAFFRGDLSSQSGEPALARQIATEGQEWVRAHWRREDMTAYVFRLYLEWARLLATDKRGADLVYNESMERSTIP